MCSLSYYHSVKIVVKNCKQRFNLKDKKNGAIFNLLVENFNYKPSLIFLAKAALYACITKLSNYSSA